MRPFTRSKVRAATLLTTMRSPVERGDISGTLLTQCMMESPKPPAVFDDSRAQAYRMLEA